ncbi:polycomb group RING finger protein 3-like isoform X2 [Oxyura jamaicensis]|nr:polycomb group RING finger protein 3-like isoform X2 [Oxyura jamaicensis]
MMTRKIKLWDINAHITCHLCNGYLIDATTVTECLHTFCRSCLVKYLEENNTCPTCRIVIHQSHPLQYIGHDRTMQDIVYKLVPGLQEAEMKKQKEFYHKLGMEVPGDIKGETCSSKQHLDSYRNGETKTDENSNKETSEEKEDNDYHRSDEQALLCMPSFLWGSLVVFFDEVPFYPYMVMCPR